MEELTTQIGDDRVVDAGLVGDDEATGDEARDLVAHEWRHVWRIERHDEGGGGGADAKELGELGERRLELVAIEVREGLAREVDHERLGVAHEPVDAVGGLRRATEALEVGERHQLVARHVAARADGGRKDRPGPLVELQEVQSMAHELAAELGVGREDRAMVGAVQEPCSRVARAPERVLAHGRMVELGQHRLHRYGVRDREVASHRVVVSPHKEQGAVVREWIDPLLALAIARCVLLRASERANDHAEQLPLQLEDSQLRQHHVALLLL